MIFSTHFGLSLGFFLFRGFLEVALEFWDIVILWRFEFCFLAYFFHREFAERGESFRSQLVNDVREHFRNLLVFSLARNGESVGLGRCLNLKYNGIKFISFIQYSIQSSPPKKLSISSNSIFHDLYLFLLYLGVGEVNDRSVISEHVNFLDTRDGVDGELLELRLEFFVVSVGSLVHDLLLPAGSTFASDSDVSLLKTIVQNKK